MFCDDFTTIYIILFGLFPLSVAGANEHKWTFVGIPYSKNVTTLVMTITGQGGIPVYYYVGLLVVCSLFKFDCYSWFLLIRVAKGCLYRRSQLTLHAIHLTNLPWVSKPRGLERMSANTGQFDHQKLVGFVRSTIQIRILTFLVFSKCCVNMSYAPLQVLSLLIMMSKSEWHHSQLIKNYSNTSMSITYRWKGIQYGQHLSTNILHPYFGNVTLLMFACYPQGAVACHLWDGWGLHCFATWPVRSMWKPSNKPPGIGDEGDYD